MRNSRSDVLIIGGGVTGALLADTLSGEGLKTIVVDRRDFGHGSTAASTALLMYEVDRSLADLTAKYGRATAERAYRASVQALESLITRIESLDVDCGFKEVRSLYFASSPKDAARLPEECRLRREAGIDVDFLPPSETARLLPHVQAASLMSHRAAQVDPMLLTEALICRAMAAGAEFHSHVTIRSIESDAHRAVAFTDDGRQIEASAIIVSAGYESHELLQIAPGSLHSTYVICSQPLPEQCEAAALWNNRLMAWETERPYIYLRSTPDRRVLIGGYDVPFEDADARDALLTQQSRRLEHRWREVFPDSPFVTEYAWTGTFGESEDGLPFIGSPDRSRCFHAMCFGGNGLTWAMLASQIIRDLILERPNEQAELFSFQRA